jgi:polysaccharide biosynthesis/export protein VpsN
MSKEKPQMGSVFARWALSLEWIRKGAVPSLLLLGGFSFLLVACTGASRGRTASADVLGPQADLIRVGDELVIRLTGVPADDEKVLAEPVPEDGMVSMPLLKTKFKASGKTVTLLKHEIEAAYREARIYATPNITITISQRFVNVIGEIRAPQRVSFTKDMTALGAISACGGFTEYANKRSVRILREGQVINFNAGAALNNPQMDIPLRAGDQVQVPRTVF